MVIVSHNPGPFLYTCLERLAASTTERFALEAVVVDNASVDDTVERLRTLPYPWLRVIAHTSNAGFAVASNIGIRALAADYILLLNPDTELQPGTLDTMIQFMEAHPEAAVSSPRLVLPNGELDPACHRGFPTPWASLTYMAGLEKLFPRRRLFNGYHRWHEDLDQTHEIDAPSGAFMLIRSRVIEVIGVLDERFFMYTEDVDFCLRARKAGYRIYYHPAETVLHVKGTTTGIKRHTEHLSQASMETRLLCLNAFYDSTKKFYDKHYARAYPLPLKWAVHGLVEAGRPVAVWRLKRRLQVAAGAPLPRASE